MKKMILIGKAITDPKLVETTKGIFAEFIVEVEKGEANQKVKEQIVVIHKQFKDNLIREIKNGDGVRVEGIATMITYVSKEKIESTCERLIATYFAALIHKII